ncbi:MAG TPA: hypothetical protein VIR38_02795 [Thalassobaculum sp.]
MANDKPKVEFLDDPNPLHGKVKVKAGADAADLIARAEDQVRRLGAEFETIFAESVPTLAEAMTEVRQAGMARERGLIRMRRLLHDLRGQAGTFGYPLVSQVGDSACKFIDLSEDFSETEVEVIGMHVDALKAIAQSKIKGDGGPIGLELMSGLRKVILKYNAGGTG